MNNKLSPNIKLGCKSCNKNLEFDINENLFKFNVKKIDYSNKVSSIKSSLKKKTNNKVTSLF